MKNFSSHFTESYITEGGMSPGDLYKRKNKSGFIEKGNKEELISTEGDKIAIKDKSEWKSLVSDIEASSDPKEVENMPRRLQKALGVSFTKIDKIANGFSTMTGKDPSGEDWEAGITVALDKIAGRNFMDTPEWERFGKYWSDWEDQAMAVAKDLKSKIGISELKQTGSSRASLSSVWKGTNATPKTDLLGGKHRISLKKAGGSQLMSAGKEEAVSTVEAAMATYSQSGKGKREFNNLLKSLEDNMIKMSEKGQMSKMRDDPKFAKEIEIADAKSAQINADLEKYINSSIGFKSHFCWEAATGHTKFGRDTWPTATLIVTFKGTGGLDHYLELDTPEKAGKTLAKGNSFYVSFKSSGSSAPYLSLRSRNLPKSALTDGYIPTFAEIVAEETLESGIFLTEDLMHLDEISMLNKLKRGAKSTVSKVSDAAKKALDMIKNRLSQAFNMIKKLGAKAWQGLLNFFGLTIGKVSVRGGGRYPLL